MNENDILIIKKIIERNLKNKICVCDIFTKFLNFIREPELYCDACYNPCHECEKHIIHVDEYCDLCNKHPICDECYDTIMRCENEEFLCIFVCRNKKYKRLKRYRNYNIFCSKICRDYSHKLFEIKEDIDEPDRIKYLMANIIILSTTCNNMSLRVTNINTGDLHSPVNPLATSVKINKVIFSL